MGEGRRGREGVRERASGERNTRYRGSMGTGSDHMSWECRYEAPPRDALQSRSSPCSCEAHFGSECNRTPDLMSGGGLLKRYLDGYQS